MHPFIATKFKRPTAVPMAFTLPKEATARIISLREERKRAINHHEFERAQELEQEIAQVKEDAVDDSSAAIFAEFQSAVTNYITRWRQQYSEIQAESNRLIFNIRDRYHRQFTELQVIHKQKLLKAEKEYEDLRIREDLRRQPKLEQILEQSKKAAAASEYATAVSLREESRRIAQADLEGRLTNLETSFLSNRDAMFEQFREEFRQLTARLTAEIHKVIAKTRQRLDSEEKNKDTQMNGLKQKAQSKLGLIGVTDKSTALDVAMAEILAEG
jgi:hypothetical protein